MTAPSFSDHDHNQCIASALERADAHCRTVGAQFTQQRRRVLEILLEEHRALGAYEILDQLKADGMPAQPPVAYRALDFLVKHGLAHKIERLNAFIACDHIGGTDHTPAFLICRICSAVAEMEGARKESRLNAAAKEAGFTIEATVVEAEGVCPNCSKATAP